MRITQDGHTVLNSDQVYEILWAYCNDEISEAFPHKTKVVDVPEEWRIWKAELRCRGECWRLNKANRERVDQMINNNR